MADTLAGRRTSSPLVATAKAILAGRSVGGAGADLASGGLGGLLKQLNAAANDVGRDSADGDTLIRAALKLRKDNPREFRGRGVRRR